MSGKSFFRSPPAPEIVPSHGETRLRQRLTVLDIRQKKRSGSCDKGTAGGFPFLKPETDKVSKKSFFRTGDIDKEAQQLTKRIAALSPAKQAVVAQRLGIEPSPIALWNFLKDYTKLDDPIMLRVVSILDEIVPQMDQPSPTEAVSLSPQPGMKMQLKQPKSISKAQKAPKLGPISSYPFVDVRYSYSPREGDIHPEAITLGMNEFDQTFVIPGDLSASDHAIIQCFTVGIVPAMVLWPVSCSIFVNGVLVKGSGICKFPLIDVSEFGRYVSVRIVCGVEQQLFALLLRVSTFRRYRELVNMIKEVRRDNRPVTGDQRAIVIDPISGRLMRSPGKGINCRHDQCFDLKAFITRANMLRQWTCPICNMSATFEELMFNQHTADIIFRAKANTEVAFHPYADELPQTSDFDIHVIDGDDDMDLFEDGLV